MRLFPLLLAMVCTPCFAQSSPGSFSEAKAELERVLREEPEAFEKHEAALKHLESCSADAAKEVITSFELSLAKRRRDVAATQDAIQETKAVYEEFRKDKDVAKAAASWKKISGALRGVTWTGNRQNEWHVYGCALVVNLLDQGTKLKAEAEPDWMRIAETFMLASDIAGFFPYGQGVQEALIVSRETNAALGKLYFESNWRENLPWIDVLDKDIPWKSDEFLTVQTTDGVRVIENRTDKPGMTWLNKAVGWQDYTIRMDITVNSDSGCQVMQRMLPGEGASATHDLTMLMAADVVRVDQRITLGLSVFGPSFRLSFGDTLTRPAFCAPAGSKSGGFAFRLPPKSKVTIHKLEVQVWREEK